MIRKPLQAGSLCASHYHTDHLDALSPPRVRCDLQLTKIHLAVQYIIEMVPSPAPSIPLLCSLLFSAALLTTGCAAVGPDYTRSDPAVPPSWNTTLSPALTGREPDPLILARWWDAFGDPVLTRIVEKALAKNPDLDLAMSRIREARARRDAERAGLLFTLDASGSATRSKGSRNTGGGASRTLYKAGLDAGWEIDLFGGQRRSVEASEADLQASREEYNAALVTLCAEVGLNYLELRGYQERLRVATANLAIQEETFRLTKARVEAGLGDEFDLQRARSSLETTRAVIPSLTASVEGTMNRLAVLAGEAPGALHGDLAARRPLPRVPETIAVGVPADLLRRRPDIRKAERELAAQSARLGVAESQLYPQLTLSGSIGLDALDASDLFTRDARGYSYGPRLSVPLFHAGALRKAVEIQDARLEQARISYTSTVLQALEEVEDALVSYREETGRNRALRSGVDASRKALLIAQASYASGRTDLLDLLDAQRTLLGLEDSLATSDTAVAVGIIRIYKTLGGGWQAASGTDHRSAEQKEP